MALDLGTLSGELDLDDGPFDRVLAQSLAKVRDWGRRGARIAAGAGRTIGQGYAGELGRMMRTADRAAGTGFRNIGKGLAGPAALVAKFGAGAAVAFGVAAGAAAGFGIKVASGNEQAQISFTTMLGSAKKAGAFLGQLRDFAAKTPFEFPELQTAAGSLISVGIKAKDIIPIMTSLGNATAGMGTGAEGVKRATVALQQMTAAGRITAEDLNQLRDAGVPVFELLTAATGKTTAEIAHMAANGKLGRKELEQLMAALRSGKGLERFSGLMDKQSRSLAGLWSTFKDTAGQALAGVATTAFPLMKSGLAAISAGLGHLSAWVAANKGSLSRVFAVVGPTLKTLASTVGTVFSSIAAGFGLGQGSFEDFADFVSTHQEGITSAIVGGGKAFVAFGTVIAQIASGGLRAFGAFADGVGHVQLAIMEFIGGFQHAFTVAFGWIPGFGPKLKDAEAKFAALTDHVRGNVNKTGDAARGLADGIDNKLLPGLHAAARGLDEMGNKSAASARARDIVAKAEIGHRVALDAATAAAKLNGKTLDKNTVSGQNNRTALTGLVGTSQSYIQKLIDTNTSSKRVTDATKTAKAEFVKVAISMGVSRDRAKELAERYFKIPTKRETKVTQPGMPKAIESVKELATRIAGIKSKSVSLSMKFAASATAAAVSFFKTVPGSQASGFVNSFRATGGPIAGYSPHAKADNIPIMATAGEFMQQKSAVDYYGRDTMADINARRVPREVLRRADGGPIERYLKINTTRNALPSAVNKFGPAGLAAASDLGGDAVRSLGSVGQKALNALVAAAMGGPGGPIGGKGYAAALTYARRHAGHPYIFGTLWDCSGFISALHSIILGQSPHRRYSTPAFHGAHAAGFTRGKRSPFMVGVNPSPGRFGHMAGTLNGVNVESAGGVGVRVGGRARGWNNGMFSWRGGLAKGGVIGDLPYDLLDPRGERYTPWLADLVRRGYAGGTLSASAGIRPVAERGAELVVNPQWRRFKGGERVYDDKDTRKALGGLGVGTIQQTNHFPATMTPEAAAEAAGGRLLAVLRAGGI